MDLSEIVQEHQQQVDLRLVEPYETNAERDRQQLLKQQLLTVIRNWLTNTVNYVPGATPLVSDKRYAFYQGTQLYAVGSHLLWLELTSSGAWKAGESRVYSIGESVGDTYDLDSPSGLRLLRQISLSDIVRAAVELAIVHRWEMPKLNFEISNEDAHLFMPTRVSYEFFPTFSQLPPLSPPAYEPFPSYEAMVPDPDTYDDRPRARRGLFRRQR